MGRIFLVAILVGLGWGGYKIYQNITGLTDPDALASRYHAEARDGRQELPEKTEGQDSGGIIKDVLARSTGQEIGKKVTPLPVLGHTKDFLQVEAWGIVRPGDELPDGSVIRSWSDDAALVTNEAGELERRRFRRPAEVMALAFPAVAASVPHSSVPLFQQGSQDQLSGTQQ